MSSGCLKKIKVLIGKYFSRFFKKNLSVDIFSVWVIYPWNLPLIVNVWFLTSSIVLMPIQLNSYNSKPQGDSKLVRITWVFEL